MNHNPLPNEQMEWRGSFKRTHRFLHAISKVVLSRISHTMVENVDSRSDWTFCAIWSGIIYCQ